MTVDAFSGVCYTTERRLLSQATIRRALNRGEFLTKGASVILCEDLP